MLRKQAGAKEAAKQKIDAEKAAIDNDEADKKAKAAEKVAVGKRRLLSRLIK